VEDKIKELIEIQKIKLKTITDLIQSEKTEEKEMDKLQSCRRFVSGFISELEKLLNY